MELFENQINENIKQAIREELSINSQVSDFAYEIYKEVVENISKNYSSNATHLDGYGIYEFSFKKVFNEKKVLISVNYFNFKSWSDYYFKSKETIDCKYGTSQSDGDKMNFITVYCYGISGRLDKASTLDTIQHEVEHIFQAISGQKQITIFDSNYSFAAQHLMDNENKILKLISSLVYYSYEYEQDAYVNGLYAMLMNSEYPTPSWDEIKQSEAYTALKKLRTSISVYINPDEAFKRKSEDIARERFGMSLNSILKKAFQADSRLVKKIGKVLIKVKKDKKIHENNSGRLTYFWI